MAKKNFKVETAIYNSSVSKPTIQQGLLVEKGQIPPLDTVIKFPQNASSCVSFDFMPFYGKGCDEVVYYCQHIIGILNNESMASQGQSLSISTIVHYCYGGLRKFLPFCQMMAATLKRDLTLQDLDKDMVTHFIAYLREHNNSKVTQKGYYTQTKSVLMALAKRGMLDQNIFPKNPYPKTNRLQNGQKPLSKTEHRKVTRALKVELQCILGQKEPLSRYDLSICVLGIALRTGLNPTPILELPVNCLQPHPIKANRQLLVSFKRRGYNTHIQSLRKSKEFELFKTVMLDVVDIVEMVVARNSMLREKSSESNRLFMYESVARINKGQIVRLSKAMLDVSIRIFIQKHKINNDDGELLKLNIMRLRKTFVNRLWELSGQDALVTAALAGHTVKVSDNHYLEAPPEAEKNWRLMGEIRTEELLDKRKIVSLRKENTPIAGCQDNRYGHLAPKNESHCTNFLACFRCRSFVVTSDDLFRLFSFYWLLVSERNQIGAKRWSRYYAHIIRIIDNQIAPQFDRNNVVQVRQKSKSNPHPFWRNREHLISELP